jgi:hypothetical protein
MDLALQPDARMSTQQRLKRLWIGWTPLAMLLAAATPAQAEDAPTNRFVSAQLGLSSVNNDIGSGVAFGVEGAFFPQPEYGGGAFLRAGNHSNDITSFFFGVEGLYRPSLFLEGITLGATLGSGKFTAQGLSGDSALAFGLKGAYDYRLVSQPISLGIDLSVTWCKPGDTTLTTVSPLLTAKWWF